VKDRWRWVTMALILLTIAALPTMLYPLTRDQGTYAYIADLMLHGGVPYRDALDLKPPGVYVLYAVGFLVFGRSEMAIRWIDMLFTLFAAVSVYWLALELLAKREAAALAGWLYAMGYVSFVHFYAVANPESFMVPFLVLSLVAVTKGVRQGAYQHFLWSGLAAGAGLWLKPTAVIVLAPALACAAAFLWRGRPPPRKLGAQAGPFLVGALAVILAPAAFLYDRGLSQLLELWRDYGLGGYQQASGLVLGSGPLAVLDVLLGYLRDWQLLAWLTAAGCLLGLARAESRRVGLVLSAFLAAALASVCWQGKFFEYHWVPALAPASILSAWALSSLWEEARAGGRGGTWDARGVFSALALIGLLLLGIYDRFPVYRRLAGYLQGSITREEYDRQFDIGRDYSHVAATQAAAYLRDRTSPGDTVLIWGAEPLLHFLSQRRSPTRFIFPYMLFDAHDPVHAQAQRALFLEELQQSPPAYVVLVDNDAHPLSPGGSLALLQRFPGLQSWLDQGYKLEGQVEDYHFYRAS